MLFVASSKRSGVVACIEHRCVVVILQGWGVGVWLALAVLMLQVCWPEARGVYVLIVLAAELQQPVYVYCYSMTLHQGYCTLTVVCIILMLVAAAFCILVHGLMACPVYTGV